jgi:uracil-DNA glycosylase family 4
MNKTPIAVSGYGYPSNADEPCCLCPALAGNTRTQVVYASNCMIGGLLVVGEAPGKKEDLHGEGFVGRTGYMVDRLLLEHGVKRQDYGRANVCRCLPHDGKGGYRIPNATEITNCLPHLATLIDEMKPKVVLAIGITAVRVFCGKAPLCKLIEAREQASDWSAAFGAPFAHQQLQSVLDKVQYLVPMPHARLFAWNQKTPAGAAWIEIAKRQVEVAATLLNLL